MRLYDRLEYDFVHQNGHYLMIGGEGLSAEELDPIESNMLRYNRIPRLLPVVFEEVDLRLSLWFRLEGKKMLIHELQCRPFQERDLYYLLAQIAVALDESKNYMLSPEHFILDGQFIFVGDGWEDIYLTYLPLKTMRKEKSLQEELLDLTEHIVRAAGGWSESVREMFRFLREKPIETKTWKQYLMKCYEQAAANAKEEKHISMMDKPNPNEGLAIPLSLGAGIEKSKEERKEMNAAIPHTWMSEGYPLQTDDVPPKGKFYSAEGFTLLAAGGTFVITLFMFLSGGGLPGWLAGFFLAAGLLFLFLLGKQIWGKRKVLKPEMMDHFRKNRFDSFAMAGTSLRASDGNMDFLEEEEKFWFDHVDGEAKGEKMEGPAEDLSHTTVLSAPQPTVLLEGNESVRPFDAFLVSVQSDGTVKRPIDRDPFWIGRDENAAHWVDKDRQVSRLHLEIRKDNGRYWIQDLSSRNGSSLNGEKMIPYKIYPLKNNDVIRFANKEVIFKSD